MALPSTYRVTVAPSVKAACAATLTLALPPGLLGVEVEGRGGCLQHLRRGQGVLGLADVELQNGRRWAPPGGVDVVVEHQLAAIELADVTVDPIVQFEHDAAFAGRQPVLLIKRWPLRRCLPAPA